MKRTVNSGIDNLSTILPTLQGAKLGLITNPTGMDKHFHSTIDLLHGEGLLSCLFSPEHGVRGEHQAGAKVQFYTDDRTGLPVHSTYGGNLHIDKSVMESGDAEMLQDLVITAVNEAVRVGRANLEREMANISGGIRLPGMF